MRCRIHQRNMSIALAAGEPLSPRLERHLARCERCRKYRDELEAIGRRLRQAVPPQEPLSPELSGRILGAIRSAGAERPKPPARIIPLRTIVAVAAAACVLLGLGLLAMVWPWDAVEQPVVRLPKPQPQPITPPGPEDLTKGLWPGVENLTSAPMMDEMERLADDTRRIGSAMLACLPMELIRGGDGEWIDALLPGLSAPRPATRAPTSRPDSSPG